MTRTILVTGATGKQGKTLIAALSNSDADIDILALTRDTTSASAQALLKHPRVTLIPGNLDDPDSIFARAAELHPSSPIWGVFSVQVAIGNPREVAQGKSLVDAALAHGVSHFVYSSADRGGEALSDTDPTDVPHFRSKFAIERHLVERAGDRMTWTILRPVAFFENFVPGFMGKLFSATWDAILRPGKKLQLIATGDIAFFAAEAFVRSEDYKGRKVSLAGDELTYAEFKGIFEETIGSPLPVTYHWIARIFAWLIKDFGRMYRWFDRVGFGADIVALKKVNPGMKDLRTWLVQDSEFSVSKKSQ